MIRARFFVAGEPATQGSKRIVQPKGHRRPMLIEVSKKLKPWRTAVAAEAFVIRQKLGASIDSPVSLCLSFTCQRPKRPRSAYPSLDLDKLCRAVGDALVEGGLLVDDRLIVTLVATKIWSWKVHAPGCDIAIEDA